MKNLEQAARQALDALEDIFGKEKKDVGAINALRQALEQPKQEPFEYWNAVEGWVKVDEVRQHFDSVGCGTIYKTAGEGRVPLYAEPPKGEWVGLTDEEIREIDSSEFWNDHTPLDFARVIEAKLKEKNT